MSKVFLTGASAGIGRAIAEKLIAHGHEVWGTARALERVPTLERLHPVALELGDQAALASVFQSALAEAGHFDVLINNAGSGHFGPAESVTAEERALHFQILALAPMELTLLAAESMRAQSTGGLIINISSLAAQLPLPFMATYDAAKAALAAFSAALQLEWAHGNVRVVDLQPGDISTGFHRAAAISGPLQTDVWQRLDDHMQNAPPPELVAHAVLAFMQSPAPAPRVVVGDFFQARVAPLLLRAAPRRWLLWGLRRYFRC